MLLLFLATLVYSVVCGCPPGYEDLVDAKKCVKYVPTASSFNDALDNCRREGGDLVSVPNAFFNSALFELRGSGDMILLGLVLHTKSNWAWTDSATFHYTNWALHQPSSGNECVALNGNDATWYSVSCQQDMPYFCEHAETSGCPSNWKAYNGNCYDFRSSSEQALTWVEAEEDCVKDGAHLASIHSQEENDVVASSLDGINYCDTQWIGLGCQKKMTWSDGTPVDYTHEDVSCPFKVMGMLLLLVLVTLADSVFGGCPPGYVNIEPKCVKRVTEKTGFAPAHERWRREGGDLVSVPNAFFNAALAQLQGTEERTLLGIENRMYTWGWSDGTNYSYSNWAKWDHGRPPSGGCAVLSSNDSKWYQECCEEYWAYFCEHDEITECPKKWTAYNGNCYEYRNLRILSADEAETDCAYDGAHLASIHSKEENDVVAGLLPADSCAKQWIGLNCSRELIWNDGSAVDYTHDNVSCPVTRGYTIGNKDKGGWVNEPAGTRYASYICKSPWPCRSGWSSYNTACYIVKSEHYTSEEAEKACRRDNSHLVSISDAAEDSFVSRGGGVYLELIRHHHTIWKMNLLFACLAGFSNTWIGLECAAGSLSWTDGNDVDYKPYSLTCSGSGPRYQMFAGNQCAHTYPSGSWVGASLHEAFAGHVCKKPY